MVIKGPEVLALIPARGGSKGLPRKNIRPLAGHSLVAYSIETALQSSRITRTVVSTDDPDIARIAQEYGAEIPFMRPSELAQDNTPDLPVFRHALMRLKEKEGYEPEIVVHLRPTSPLRKVEHIAAALDILLENPQADSVRSVAPPTQNPFKMWCVRSDGYLEPLMETDISEAYNSPRQELPGAFWQTGYVDVTRWHTLMELQSMTGRRILPLFLARDDWIDIDTDATLQWAEFAIQSGIISPLFPIRRCSGSKVHLPLARVQLLVLDFDGVLTDNRVWVTEQGQEAVTFSRSDGMAVSLLREAGVETFVLSTEENPVVSARCKKLGIRFLKGVGDKLTALRSVAGERALEMGDLAYVGNDVNDIPCLEAVGLGIAVADAHPDAKHRAGLVLKSLGGKGAVREVCDLILAERAAHAEQLGFTAQRPIPSDG